jgi:hypothetical protein
MKVVPNAKVRRIFRKKDPIKKSYFYGIWSGIEGDIYKLVPFFQHGDLMYATEKIIFKQTIRTLLHGSGKLSGSLKCMGELDNSAFSGLSLSSIFSHGKS